MVHYARPLHTNEIFHNFLPKTVQLSGTILSGSILWSRASENWAARKPELKSSGIRIPLYLKLGFVDHPVFEHTQFGSRNRMVPTIWASQSKTSAIQFYRHLWKKWRVQNFSEFKNSVLDWAQYSYHHWIRGLVIIPQLEFWTANQRVDQYFGGLDQVSYYQSIGLPDTKKSDNLMLLVINSGVHFLDPYCIVGIRKPDIRILETFQNRTFSVPVF
jgi:hypothetical protein